MLECRRVSSTSAQKVSIDTPFAVQHAVDAVPDIGFQNNGGAATADAHIALQATSGRRRVGRGWSTAALVRARRLVDASSVCLLTGLALTIRRLMIKRNCDSDSGAQEHQG